MAADGGGRGSNAGAINDGQSAEVVAAATEELRQMSTSQNPDYGRLANFDIERKVCVYTN